MFSRYLTGKGSYKRKIIMTRETGCFSRGLTQKDIQLLKNFGAEDLEPLPLVNGIICTLPVAGLEKMDDCSDSMIIEDDLPVQIKPLYTDSRFVLIGEFRQTIPWGVFRTGAHRVWEKACGKGVKVAILDTGIDVNHPELAPSYRGGINLINPNRFPADDNGHGTSIAGIIAAADNGTGIVGVAPCAELYAVKVLNHRGQGTISTFLKGLQWCIDNGIQVVNMSIGTDINNAALARAVSEMFSRGIIMVAAAGNDGGQQTVDYPAAYRETIAVTAVDYEGLLAWFSSQGPEVTIAAPGVGVLSTGRWGSFQRLSGTSMAAAHVSGVIALVMEALPGINPARAMSRILNTAEKLNNLTREQQGSGFVRADRAVGITSSQTDITV